MTEIPQDVQREDRKPRNISARLKNSVDRIKKANVSSTLALVAETGLEPVTYGL